MDKIYLVTSGEYSSYGIVAAFSSIQKANKLLELLNDDSADVEEYEIDPEFGNYTIYTLYMEKNGLVRGEVIKSQSIFPMPPYHYFVPAYTFGKDKINECMKYIVMCKSEEQAIKSANEIRTQLIALNRWGINDNS